MHMCICCASAEFAFEEMHMIEPRTKKIKPQLDLTVGVWLSYSTLLKFQLSVA